MADGRSTPPPISALSRASSPLSEAAVRDMIREEVVAAVSAALSRNTRQIGGPRDHSRQIGGPRDHSITPRCLHSVNPAALALSSLPVSLPSILLIPATVAEAGSSLHLSTSAPTPMLATSSGSHSIPLADPRPKPASYKVANSIVPIPAKLVKRIQALEYVDMRELLPDNIALSERLAALPPGLAPPKPPGEREIGGERALVTWVSSFSTYVAIVAEAHPERVGDMLAYIRLVIREASKFGGMGWLTYDPVFRRNQEGLSTPWNFLDASLYQVYIANQRSRIAIPCEHCHEVDHPASKCAVASLLPKNQGGPSDRSPSPTHDRSSTRGKRPPPYPWQCPISTSWNAGSCKFPGKCTYAHVYTYCYGGHPAASCKETAHSATALKQAKKD